MVKVMKTDQLQNLHTIPAGNGVKKLGPQEGRTIDIGGVRLTWKATGEERKQCVVKLLRPL